MFLNITLFLKRIKNSTAGFFSPQTLLAEEIKRKSLTKPVFNLKAFELGAFLTYFHLFVYLKVMQLFSKIVPKHCLFEKLALSDKKKNRLKIALQVSKLAFSPIVMHIQDALQWPRNTLTHYVFLYIQDALQWPHNTLCFSHLTLPFSQRDLSHNLLTELPSEIFRNNSMISFL